MTKKQREKRKNLLIELNEITVDNNITVFNLMALKKGLSKEERVIYMKNVTDLELIIKKIILKVILAYTEGIDSITDDNNIFDIFVYKQSGKFNCNINCNDKYFPIKDMEENIKDRLLDIFLSTEEIKEKIKDSKELYN